MGTGDGDSGTGTWGRGRGTGTRGRGRENKNNIKNVLQHFENEKKTEKKNLYIVYVRLVGTSRQSR